MLYRSQTKLLGILYCHRITDIRMSGSSRKSIVMLEKLCGAKAFGHVVIVTTMWDALDNKDVGEQRTKQLLGNTRFFGKLVDGGATHCRLDPPTRETVVDLIRLNLDPSSTVVLDIQRQLASGLTLEETPVGQYVSQELLEKRAKYEQELREMREALRKARESQDDDSLSALSEEERHQRELLFQLDEDRKELRRNITQVAEQENPEYANLCKSLDAANKDREVMLLRKQVDELKAELRSERNLQQNELRKLERRYGERSAVDSIHIEQLNETLYELRQTLRQKEERSRGKGLTREFVVRSMKRLLA
jgi:hypothetical protein